MVHIDSHTDLYGEFNGARIHHGNPFLCAVEENLLDCRKVAQIGLRGTGFDDDYALPRKLVSLHLFMSDQLSVPKRSRVKTA